MGPVRIIDEGEGVAVVHTAFIVTEQPVLQLPRESRMFIIHAKIMIQPNTMTQFMEKQASMGSFHALFGLGKSYYALGEKESAKAAFCEATLRSPNSGPAFNNLAQVLWEQGKQKDALKAARRAVEIGGPLLIVYRETLEEIQA